MVNYARLSTLLLLLLLLKLEIASMANPINYGNNGNAVFSYKNAIKLSPQSAVSHENIIASIDYCDKNPEYSLHHFRQLVLASELFFKLNAFNYSLSCINKGLTIADSIHLALSDRFHLYKMQSVSLEESGLSDEALENWKNKLKNIEFQQDTFNTLQILFQIIRINNNLNLPEKGQLYLAAVQQLIKPILYTGLYFELEIENVRNLMLLMRHEEALTRYLKLVDQSVKTNETRSLNTDIKLVHLAQSLNLKPNAINLLVDRLIRTYNQSNDTVEKIEAFLFFGQYYRNIDLIIANDFLHQAVSLRQTLIEKDHALKQSFALLDNKHFNSTLNKQESSALSKDNIILVLFLIFCGSIIFVFIYKMKALRKQYKVLLENSMSEKQQLVFEMKNDNTQIDERVAERMNALKLELFERERIDSDLKEALKKADEANYLKNAFLSNMSHEIRTPLNGILGFSALLETELALIEQPELFEYANSIQKSGERLLHLLNNIIDFSRLEANDIEMNVTECNLHDVMDEVVGLNQFRANEKGLRIVKEIESCCVLADRPTLGRVLSELIDNAIKYTEKGFIKISIRKQGEIAQIQIRDTGVGIDDQYLPFIFDAFRQESLGYTRQYQGAGLGLPLAKRLTNKMGGQLKIESEKAVGTLLSIEIPLSTSEINSLPSKPPSDGIKWKQLSNQLILIVEDDKISRTMIRSLLNPVAKIIEASDGKQALALIEQYYNENVFFDLMIFDINLPAPWDGIKLMETIKAKMEPYKKIPFIAQTAYAMAGDKEKMLQAGFDAYVSKPIFPQELLNAIGTAINNNEEKNKI